MRSRQSSSSESATQKRPVESQSKYEVGVIGAGNITTTFHLPILSNMNETEISYVADIDRTRAKQALLSYSGEAVQIDGDVQTLPDCDIALLATPVGTRSEYIQEFVSRDVPIMTEKPFASSVSDHREIIETSDHIACNYQFTNVSTTRQARTLLETTAFGTLQKITITQGLIPVSGISKDHYRHDVELSGGGVLMESGCHTFSQLELLFQNKDISVTDAEIKWDNRLDVAAKVGLSAELTNRKVPIEYSISAVDPLENEFRFVYEDVDVWFDHTDPESRISVETDGDGDETLSFAHSAEWATTGKEAAYLNWHEFIRKVDQNLSIDVAHSTGLKTTELLMDTYRTAGDRRDLG